MAVQAFQRVEVADSIRSDPAVRAAVERATEMLMQEVTASGAQSCVDWRFATGNGSRRSVELRISDTEGSVSSEFNVDEMQDDWEFRGKLSKLWDDLLRNRFDRSHARLREVVASLESE